MTVFIEDAYFTLKCKGPPTKKHLENRANL